MLKRKHLVLGFLTFCLTATLLIGATCSIEPYDPWKDIDENGKINILDILALAVMFGEEGTPINKTALLLELLDRVPRAGNISVPAAAFVPNYNTYDCGNNGGTLYNYEASTTIMFYAAVQLPHGATVTNFTTYWYDVGPSNVYCYLDQRNLYGNFYEIAHAHSTGDTGSGGTHATSINSAYATVDNNQYGYTLQVTIPFSASHMDYRFHLAIIEYEY